MSHNLNFNENLGRHAFASSSNKPAWHSLGIQIGHLMTAEEAVCEAGLCYDIVSHPLVRDDGKLIESHRENRREDTQDTLGIVGKDYEIIQNKDCFSFFDNIVGGKEAIYETAGALGRGEVVFITAKLPKSVVIGPEGLIEMYLVLTNSHDMSLRLSVFFTPVRVVCNNTLNMALRDCHNKITLKHTKNIKDSMFDAAKAMGLSSKYLDKVEEVSKFLYDREITDKDLKNVLEKVFLDDDQLKQLATTGDVDISTRKANMIKEVLGYYSSDASLNGIRGTRYGALNALTGYFQNRKNFTSEDSKMKNIVLHGTSYGYVNKAMEVLLKV